MSMGAMRVGCYRLWVCWLCSSSPPLAAAETGTSTLWCQPNRRPAPAHHRPSPRTPPLSRRPPRRTRPRPSRHRCRPAAGSSSRRARRRSRPLRPIRAGGPCTGDLATWEPRDVGSFDLFSGSGGQAAGYPVDGTASVEEVLEQGLRSAGASPVHIAVRGTASADSVRCDWRGIARTPAQRALAIRYRLGLEEDEAIPSRRTWSCCSMRLSSPGTSATTCVRQSARSTRARRSTDCCDCRPAS